MAGALTTLVICDGGLCGLVALAHAAERSRDAQAVGVLPLLGDGERARLRSIERAATLAGASVLANPRLAQANLRSDARMLLSACDAADAAEAVVWPASAGRVDDPAEVDVGRAADIAETAMLVERLVSIDSGRRVRIDAPFADLPDVSLCELAMDAGVRPSACWWWTPDDEPSRVEFERWRSAFASVGLPFEALREAKPAADRPRGAAGRVVRRD